MTKKERQTERIRQHGANLLAIFPQATERDSVKLCKKLRRLESEAAAIALRLCNGPEFASEEEPDELFAAVVSKANALLGNCLVPWNKDTRVPIFINRDPRGHQLKIRDEWMREHSVSLHRDWGGYGILAPEITGDE